MRAKNRTSKAEAGPWTRAQRQRKPEERDRDRDGGDPLARVGEMFAKFSSRSKIDAVTSSKDEPTPVYALQELCENLIANPSTTESAASYLIARLQNKSVIVKQKALRAIKYVASKPDCSSFRMAVQQHAGVLREHASFSCAADPMKGNRPAEQVRQAAKEAIHAIYSTDSSSSASRGNGHAMQGFGSGGSGASTSQGGDESARASSMFSKAGGGRDRSGSGGFSVRLSWGGRASASAAL